MGPKNEQVGTVSGRIRPRLEFLHPEIRSNFLCRSDGLRRDQTSGLICPALNHEVADIGRRRHD